jgi:hypothetical protein
MNAQHRVPNRDDGGRPRSCTELRGFRVHEISFRSAPRSTHKSSQNLSLASNYSLPDVGVSLGSHALSDCGQMRRSQNSRLPIASIFPIFLAGCAEQQHRPHGLEKENGHSRVDRIDSKNVSGVSNQPARNDPSAISNGEVDGRRSTHTYGRWRIGDHVF